MNASPASIRDEPPAVSDAAPAVRWLDESEMDAERPTELTRGLLNALDRPALATITPTAFRALVAGLLTAGLYPAASLPRKWLNTMRWHANILWHLAEWLKVNVGVEQGDRFHAAASARLPTWLARMAVASAIVSLGFAAIGVVAGVPIAEFWFADPLDPSREPLATLFLAGLLASFALTWLCVNLHLRRLHRAKVMLEALTPGQPPTPGLRVARWEWGVRPLSLTLGLLLAFAGFAWALPMFIAANAQQRALLIHHRRLRGQMAHRVRELVASRRPVVALPAIIDRTDVCRNAVCDQHVPSDAAFCPRCGTPQRPISRLLQ